jgi:hypothetical protein
MMAAKAAERQVRVTIMLGNSLTDRDTLAVLELLQPESPAEILGLYIEDSELLSLAEIPVVREYCRLTQAERRLQAVELERQFRAQARIAERALAEAASPRGYPWSFRSLRGDPVVLLREMLAEVDLMLLGATAGTAPVAGRRAIAPARRPVMAVFNQTEPAARALGVAMKMADAGGTGLVVVLAATRPDELPALRERAARLVGERSVDYLEIISHSSTELLNRLRRQVAGQLVIGIPDDQPDDETIALLRRRSTCPAILVR